MRIFVDASAWVPLVVPRDQAAPRFAAILTALAGQPLNMVTSNWTLYEALALSRRQGWRTSMNLYARASEIAEVIAVDDAVEAEALRRFLTWKDKTASVVDHANTLVAVRAACDTILSFDDDFETLAAVAGLRLLR